MKKYFIQIIILVATFIVFANPISILAQTYNVDGTEVNITFGDEWHVCTRDNPVCCYEVEALGMTEEYMLEFFEKNLIYLNAGIIADFDNDGMDFIIVKDKTDFCENMSTLTKEELDKVVQEFADTVDCQVCEIYDGNHTFVHMEYVEENVNYIKYVTVYNSEYYTFTVQKASSFTKDEKKDIKEIMGTVYFGDPIVPRKNIFEYIWPCVAGAALIVAAVVVAVIIKKKLNKKSGK